MSSNDREDESAHLSDQEIARRFEELTAGLEGDFLAPPPGPRDYELAPDEAEFAAPVAPPVRFVHRRTPWAWACIALSIIGFVILGTQNLPGSEYYGLLCLGLFLTGMGLLISLLRPHNQDRSSDD